MTLDDLIAALQQIKAAASADQLLHDIPMGLEPMTALTDAILAAWTTFLAALLFSRANGREPVRLWAWGFVAAAVGALAGVAFHGCRILLTYSQTAMVWKIVPVATGAAAFCLGAAAAIAWLRPVARKVAMVFLLAEFAVCLIATARSNSFAVAAIDYALVLVAILIGCLMHWRQHASRFIAVGIIVSFLAVAVQRSGVHWRLLDFNDFFHLVQLPAMYLLYRGGVLLDVTTDA